MFVDLSFLFAYPICTTDMQLQPLEINSADFQALFETLEHTVECTSAVPVEIGLHFVRHDQGGMPMFDQLALTLASYITNFCLTASRRKDLDENGRNRAFLEAKELFRKNPQSGQAGELLIYFLIEAVLGAPQVLKKC